MIRFVQILLSISVLCSCQNGNQFPDVTSEKNNHISLMKLETPEKNASLKSGESLVIRWSYPEGTKIDSLILMLDFKSIAVIHDTSRSYIWKSKEYPVGNRTISLKAFAQGSTDQYDIHVELLSDITPKQYTYKVIHVFPHSRESYTQGLIYRNGIFYESAGEYGKSALKKVDAKTGEILNMNRLESNIFAEGLAQKGNELYQISWKEQVCIVYDMSTLEQKRRFSYEVQEGWGLEYDGSMFMMTDGGNILYYMEPQYFTIVKKVEVMDQSGPVTALNELELIDGVLYANIYTQNKIVMVDPESGKVLGIIDMTGLLSNEDRRAGTDVLNGIAYDSKTGHLFVTGKNWPKLFEIEITKL